jgi:hypothetical protein
MSEKVCEGLEAVIAFALVVERGGAQKIDLRAKVGEAIDLAVIDGADGLVRWKAGETFRWVFFVR